MTLINPRNNKKVQNYSFEKKIDYYKERKPGDDEKSTTVPLTFDIHKKYKVESKSKTFKKNEYWTSDRIDSRATEISKEVAVIWKV